MGIGEGGLGGSPFRRKKWLERELEYRFWEVGRKNLAWQHPPARQLSYAPAMYMYIAEANMLNYVQSSTCYTDKRTVHYVVSMSLWPLLCCVNASLENVLVSATIAHRHRLLVKPTKLTVQSRVDRHNTIHRFGRSIGKTIFATLLEHVLEHQCRKDRFSDRSTKYVYCIVSVDAALNCKLRRLDEQPMSDRRTN